MLTSYLYSPTDRDQELAPFRWGRLLALRRACLSALLYKPIGGSTIDLDAKGNNCG